jgi:predicted RNase H-related nuclease YkuK (DUF458 family)
MRKKDLIIAMLAIFCLATVLFTVIPVGSYMSYDPWLDYNDDGKIDARDVAPVSAAYGAKGTSLDKASIQYDSGWVDITDKCGQDIVITHGLNSTDLIVDVQGKTSLSSGPHQRYYGLTGYPTGWSKTYGGTGSDSAWSLVQTGDGGYALAGGGFANLVKADASGNMLWDKSYGGFARVLVRTNDGGYALAGGNGGDFWLVKTDGSGNAQWNKTYGGTDDDETYALVQTGDGGYAIAGFTYSLGAGESDFWLVKTDGNGNELWNKTYGGTSFECAQGLVQTGDGGYAIAGWTNSFGAGDANFWLVKTDDSGNALWNKTYGETGGYDKAYVMVQTADGGFAMAGCKYSLHGSDFWLVKTDGSGNALWNKTYGIGEYGQETAWALVQTGDGGYAIAGWAIISGHDDFWLVRTDDSGNGLWNKTYGGTADDWPMALVQTGDGGYAIAGWTNSFGAGGSDFWLVKTDANGNTVAFEYGLAWVNSAADTITLYRGAEDSYWNFVRVRLWKPR